MCGKMQCRAGDARATVWEGHYSFFYSSTADLLPAHSGCNARLSKSAGRKPASIGRLRAGEPETRVNSGLAGRQAGNARKHWASGQCLRRCPFFAGFTAGVVADVVAGVWWIYGCRWRVQPVMLPSRAAGWRGSALLVFYCGLSSYCLRVSDVMLRPARSAARRWCGFF